MTLVDLFRKGPWPIVLLAWLVALGATLGWILIPWARASVTAHPDIAALFGAAVGFLLVQPVIARYYARGGDLSPSLLILGTVLALTATSALLPGALAPTMARASECAPLVVLGESNAGRAVSFGLPWLIWLLWCRYTLSAFPPIDARIWRESSSRWDAYTRALSGVGYRALAAVGFSCLAVFAAYRQAPQLRVTPDTDHAVEILTNRGSGVLTTHERAALFAVVEMERKRAESRASSALSTLAFDEARSQVEAAVCKLALPGTFPNPELAQARSAFVSLDGEISKKPEAWQPSPASVEAILTLLPLHADTRGSLLPCPLFLRSAPPEHPVPEIGSMRDLNMQQRVVTYRGVKLVDMWLSILPFGLTQSATLEVAIRVNGAVGTGSAYPALVEKRLGVRPTEGPMTIGAGAMCARWDLGPIGLRLGPEVSPKISFDNLKPDAPLWLTCYDPALSHVLWTIYRREDGAPSWNPHGCGYLPPR
jgi:hypothetical protein